MKIYLAACMGSTILSDNDFSTSPFCLQTFYDVNERSINRIQMTGDILIDSGAFSLRNKAKENDHIYEDYVERYAEFINKYQIDKFFELDIDNLVGYKKVKAYRKELERLTNRQPIVVWHPSRGMDEFVKHCEEYPYVALGGYVAASAKKKQQYKKTFPYFINIAHEHGCKIHGLGFTSLQKLPKYHFDSVDSTTWLNGGKYGIVYKFNGETLVNVKTPTGKKTIGNTATRNNFLEWVKFQKYAETHL